MINLSNLFVTKASYNDAADLVQYMDALVNEALPFVLHRDAPPSLDEELAFIRDHTDDKGCLLVARLDGNVVGVLSFRLYQHNQMRHSGELGMSVSKPFRRKGVGSRLIQALVSWAKSHGVRRIELSVFSSNLDAIRLYTSLGFKVEGRQLGAIRVGMTYVDKILMCLHINDDRVFSNNKEDSKDRT